MKKFPRSYGDLLANHENSVVSSRKAYQSPQLRGFTQCVHVSLRLPAAIELSSPSLSSSLVGLHLSLDRHCKYKVRCVLSTLSGPWHQFDPHL